MQTRRDLVAALVGEHVQKYETNSMFHHAVDTLAAMLPAWVDGLADQAEKQAEELAERVERLQMSPPQPLLLSEESTRWEFSDVCLIPDCGCSGEQHP